MLKKGLIQVYTSESEFMNYAPYGLAMRAAGHGLRTFIAQFGVFPLMEGAQKAPTLLIPYINVQICSFTCMESASTVYETFAKARDEMFSGFYDIVMLLNVHQAVNQGAIPLQDVRDLMDAKPERIELVLTGRRVPPRIMEKADYITEMIVRKYGPRISKGNFPENNGEIEVVTGDGKGKTTYCLGKCLLTSCLGIPAVILQFVKSPNKYGEVKAISRLPYLDIKSMGRGFLYRHGLYLDQKHVAAARQAWHLWLQLIYQHDYGLIAVDEVNIATNYGLISGNRVVDALFMKPHSFDILLSGRYAHPEVVNAANVLIEMKEIKHPYRQGIKARRGIEF